MRMLIAGVLAAGLLLAPVAKAQSRDPVLAEALFREGRKAIEAGDLPTACGKFSQSYRLDPAPGTLLNLADCEEKRGQLASAWAHFNELHDIVAPNDDRRTVAKARADALAARAPRLRISLAKDAPKDAVITRDGAAIDPAAIGVAVPVDPGKHVLVVRAPDRLDRATEVTLGEGEHRDVVLNAGAPRPPPVAIAPLPPPPVHHGLGTLRIVAIALGGAAVAAAGGGAAFGALALSVENKSKQYCSGNVCTDPKGIDLHETAKTDALVADVLFGTAIAAAAAGVVVWLTAKHPAATSAYVAPAAGGLVLGGTF